MSTKRDRPLTLPSGQVILVGHRFKDISGQVFGRLTVLGPCGYTTEGQARWTCRCECGKTTEVGGGKLRRGTTRSCGCLSVETTVARSTKHNLAHRGKVIPEYRVWNTMKLRCNNPKITGYKDYGGRGISVCQRWRDSFADFIADMGRRPTSRHTIERADTNGNYEPSNCSWQTYAVQNRNRRDNRNITFNNRTQNVTDWATELGLKKGTLFHRLDSGWSVNKAFTTPARPLTDRRTATASD